MKYLPTFKTPLPCAWLALAITSRKENVNDLIDSVSLYQHSVTSWNFQQKNAVALNRQVQINMTGYYLGVYVLSFTLKDGRVYTKNIIKE